MNNTQWQKFVEIINGDCGTTGAYTRTTEDGETLNCAIGGILLAYDYTITEDDEVNQSGMDTLWEDEGIAEQLSFVCDQLGVNSGDLQDIQNMNDSHETEEEYWENNNINKCDQCSEKKEDSIYKTCSRAVCIICRTFHDAGLVEEHPNGYHILADVNARSVRRAAILAVIGDRYKKNWQAVISDEIKEKIGLFIPTPSA